MILSILLFLLSAVLPFLLHLILCAVTSAIHSSYHFTAMFWFYGVLALCGGLLFLFQLFSSRGKTFREKALSLCLKTLLILLYVIYFFRFSPEWDSPMIQCYLLITSGFCLFSAGADLFFLIRSSRNRLKKEK